MFDGKEKRLALIDELLIVASTEKINEEEEHKLVEGKQQIAKKIALKEGLQGKLVSAGLAEISKNKLKMADMKELMLFMERAEKERKARENKETGTRQAEIVLKNREERLHEEVMRVHQNTVGNFLGAGFGELLIVDSWEFLRLLKVCSIYILAVFEY